MKKSFLDYIFLFLTVIASLATIISFHVIFFDDLSEEGKYGVLFLGIIAIWLLAYNLILITKYRKKTRYINIFQSLNCAFKELHSIDREKEIIDSKEILNRLKTACTEISEAFSQIIDSHVAVCIKLISNPGNARPSVFTFCRDAKSSVNRPVGDRDQIHYLSDNSDFQFIYDSINNESTEHSYFFHNNLPYLYDYKNSRFKTFEKNGKWPPKSHLLIPQRIMRQITWPLKYKSAIIVPIIPLRIEEQEMEKLRGFLCIDSSKPFSFSPQYDVEILKGISDGMYNKIDLLQAKIADEKKEKQQAEKSYR